jgi:epoxyqueuosine reductase
VRQFTPGNNLVQKVNSHFDLKNKISSLAESEDLLFLGVADLNLRSDAARYRQWLSESRNGSMTWMANHVEVREYPEKILNGAKSVLVFGFSYYLGDRWQRNDNEKKPLIAQYARLKDYHSFLRKKVASVQKELAKFCAPEVEWRITVDSAPVLERALAFKAGAGFIGKNTCFIHPKQGSFLLLAELFTTLPISDVQTTERASGHQERTPDGGCGTCRRCQVHCPTGALDQDYKIDARKCISYWTIEHRGLIPLEYWPWVGRYLFGCDICQLVCPYNRNIGPSAAAQSLLRLTSTPDLLVMIEMDQKFYEKEFGGTPLTRAKLAGLRRNALIAAVVKNDKRIYALFNKLKEDSDPVIRGTIEQAMHYQQRT